MSSSNAPPSSATVLNMSGVANKLARLERPLLVPASSLSELLEQRCPQRNASDLVVLRVPKAGSTSFVETIGAACNGGHNLPTNGGTVWPRIRVLSAHETARTDSCQDASVAILRDPCDRLVSMYRHFDLLRALKLHKHWVHLAKTADEFVAQLEKRWLPILSTKVLPLVDRWQVERPEIRPLRSFWTGPFKHDVTLMPQALWISNFTYAICLPDFEAALVELLRAMQCGSRDAQMAHLRAHVHENVNHGENVSRLEQKVMTAAEKSGWTGRNSSISAVKYTLSPSGCDATRRLFAVDAELWDRHCRAHARDRRAAGPGRWTGTGTGTGGAGAGAP
jgi:hypothetical protein